MLGFLIHGIFIMFITFLLVLLIGIPVCVAYYRCIYKKNKQINSKKALKVGIFHPYCNDGGGGEKVLWTGVNCILKNFPNVEIAIYTGDIEYSPTEILSKVKQRFNMTFPVPINFVYLRRRKWIEAKMYPYFTLLGQSLGSLYLGMEALSSYQPDFFLDTMGYAFTYPLFKFLGHCKVATYTHYPTITSDMQKRVSGRVSDYNNKTIVANSPFLTAGKLLYYKIFEWIYSLVGKSADVILVNSSWTEDHINHLWGRPLSTYRVYPPCGVDDLKAIPRNGNEGRDIIKIVSIGQFRPEKNHPLQLRAMYQLRSLVPEYIWDKVKLVLIGGCRNFEDKKRVKDMEDLCKHLSLENNVIFKLNISYEELKQELSEGTIGLHAMCNEHFGIGVVECLAAGLITVAHKSGGPKSDIIVESDGSRNGFLAGNDMEYAHALATIIRMSPKQRLAIISAARSSVDRFSVLEFEKEFLRALEPFLNKYYLQFST